MNDPRDLPAVINSDSTSISTLIMNHQAMESMMAVADMMASTKVTIPSHLRGNKGDCMAIVMQAMQWGMSPFSIAQKTHLSQSGALGYEAQLINAVIVSSGAVRGQPEFQFIGKWEKILGKVEERKSDKGGKYYVPAWSKGDEEGLGVVVTATLRGENEPRSITVMLSQCYPRFSTQWATDPQQQITYVGVRKFSRRYAPGAILGVYTPEELDQSPSEIDINPIEGVKPSTRPPIDQPPDFYPADKFDANYPKWSELITSGKKSADDIIKTAGSKNPLTDEQKAKIRAVKKEEPAASEPDVTFAQIAEKLKQAQSLGMLEEAADLIGEIQDAEQRAELGVIYQTNREAFE